MLESWNDGFLKTSNYGHAAKVMLTINSVVDNFPLFHRSKIPLFL